MLAALGAVFRDEAGQPVTPDGGALGRIHTVDLAGVPDLSTHRDRHRQRRAEPADRARTEPPPSTGRRRAPTRARSSPSTPDWPTSSTAWSPADTRRHAQLAATAGAGAAGGLGFAGLLLGGHARLRRRLLPRPAAVRGPPRRAATSSSPAKAGSTTRPCTASSRRSSPGAPARSRSSPSSAAATSPTPPGTRMGLAAVHAIADHTDRNPADDPALSARLLEDLGRTMPLPARLTETP